MRRGKKYFKKDGRRVAPRGIRLTRKKRFEPKLKTLSGIPVRSKYEQRCADFLFENNIAFQYEPLMLLGGRQYRPDFYLPVHNIFIEICGYNHQPYYRDRQIQKTRIYEKNNLDVLFINYNGRGSLKRILEDQLSKAGILKIN
jgi:hypothetical protein